VKDSSDIYTFTKKGETNIKNIEGKIVNRYILESKLG